MIIFISAKPDHPTKNQIIQTFEHNHIMHKVIHPATSWCKLQNIIQSKATICLLVPDHPRIFKICRYLMGIPIPCINLPEITLLCRNRIEISTRLFNLLEVFNCNHPNLPIKIPKSTYFLKTSQFFSKSRSQQIEYPLVIKYPINHSGIHYVKLVNHPDDLKNVPIWFHTHGIYTQQYVDAQDLLLKCYHLGDTVITQVESHYLTLQHPSTKKKDRDTSHDDRKTIPTPSILNDLVEFIAKELQISIFGVDFLLSNDNSYWLVDFNDFPGSRGILNAGELIANFVIQEMNRIENQLLTN